MAEKPRKGKKKKTRRRKIRRDAAEISSSESDGEGEKDMKLASKESPSSDVRMAEDVATEGGIEGAAQIDEKQTKSLKQFSEADFTSWYLRQVTRELEEDLDKIRSAGDFKDSSLPVLINALQQGASLFSKEEKQRIMSTA